MVVMAAFALELAQRAGELLLCDFAVAVCVNFLECSFDVGCTEAQVLGVLARRHRVVDRCGQTCDIKKALLCSVNLRERLFGLLAFLRARSVCLHLHLCLQPSRVDAGARNAAHEELPSYTGRNYPL